MGDAPGEEYAWGIYVVIEVTSKEFRASFKKHYHCYQSIKGYDRTKRLILFYAVECGLKYRLMKRTNQNSYSELLNVDGMDDLGKSQNGHNIKLLLRKNDIFRFHIDPIHIYDRRECIQSNQFNQLWRYGVTADFDEERDAEIIFEKIARWLDEEI